MKEFIVSYSGRNSRFANKTFDVFAIDARAAVMQIVERYLDVFVQDHGDVLDCHGDLMASADDDRVRYDCGYFEAELIGC
jgi:hypothetical protein